jgi:hypothetical protein
MVAYLESVLSLDKGRSSSGSEIRVQHDSVRALPDSSRE